MVVAELDGNRGDMMAMDFESFIRHYLSQLGSGLPGGMRPPGAGNLENWPVIRPDFGFSSGPGMGMGNLERPMNWGQGGMVHPGNHYGNSGMHPMGGGNLTQAPPIRQNPGAPPAYNSGMHPAGNLEPPMNWGQGGRGQFQPTMGGWPPGGRFRG